MRALNVSPHTPTRAPRNTPSAARRTLATTRSNWASLTANTPSNNSNRYPASCAIRTNARVSFGKHDPPHPGPGRRNSRPIRRSSPKPTTTSSTSAPTPSHTAAIVFTNDNLVAKNAFAAYLMVSADAGSVTTTCAPNDAYNPATATAASRSSAPTTTRSGCRKSSIADPSRKNSGFDTTRTSGRRNTRSTTFVDPTGTVDLFTTIAPDPKTGSISAAAASTNDRSADPSASCGVGTHKNTNSASVAAVAAPTTNCSRPDASPSANNSPNPCSTTGGTPALNNSTRRASMSAHTTECPRCAKHTADVTPTYPAPTTATRATACGGYLWVSASAGARSGTRRGPTSRPTGSFDPGAVLAAMAAS